MYCKHLDAPCSLKQCALILLGGKRGDKEMHDCYKSTYADYNRYHQLNSDIKHAYSQRGELSKIHTMEKERDEIKRVLGL